MPHDLTGILEGTEAFLASARFLYIVLTFVGAGMVSSALREAHARFKAKAETERERLRKEREDLIMEIDNLQRLRFDETIAIMQAKIDKSNAKCEELSKQLEQVFRRVHLLEEENYDLREQARLRDRRIFQLENELTKRDIVIPPPIEGDEAARPRLGSRGNQ